MGSCCGKRDGSTLDIAKKGGIANPSTGITSNEVPKL